MKAIKKIDNYKRIRIPVEFQNHLGWKVNDEIEVKVVDNEIILTKVENVSDFNVVNQDNQKEDTQDNEKPKDFSLIRPANLEVPKIDQHLESEKSLQKIQRNEIKEKPPTIKEYFKLNSVEESHEESKVKIDLLDEKDKLNHQLCPKCRKPIEDSRFKLDHKFICKDCRNKLKDKLYLDILSKKGAL